MEQSTNSPAERTYADLATWLHSIADCVDTAAQLMRPELNADPYVQLSILPSRHAPEADRVATVDALLYAIFGKRGEQQPTGSGGYAHVGRGTVGVVRVSVHTGVTGPAQDEVQAELIRLRAENKHLRGELGEVAQRVVGAILQPDEAVA